MVKKLHHINYQHITITTKCIFLMIGKLKMNNRLFWHSLISVIFELDA
jgi:hypothetical protein